jgi:hypothetical protein
MPSRSQLPGELKRKKFLLALIRCGFNIDMTGGDGSHCKATWPKNQKSITIQSELRKDVLYYLLKDIEKHSGITWDDIRKHL